MHRLQSSKTARTRRTARTLRTALPKGARVLALAGVLLAGAAALAACSSPARPAAAGSTALAPGAGQSLAGMPGATKSGTAESGATTSGAPAAAGTSMPGMTMTMSAPADTAPQTPVTGNAVSIKNFAFAPSALTVKAGTTVTWTNQDSEAHTVTSRDTGGALHSAPLNPGQTYSYTFTTPGTYDYLCTIHPFMTATVTVTA